jgi:hypothetical protein
MSKINQYTAQELATRFASLVDGVETVEVPDTSAREEELSKLTKAQLVELIVKSESKSPARGITVQSVAKAILQDEECIACNYETVAEACRLLIPGANTSSKSIASYVSKKRDDWQLPDRLLIRTSKHKEPEVAE